MQVGSLSCLELEGMSKKKEKGVRIIIKEKGRARQTGEIQNSTVSWKERFQGESGQSYELVWKVP